MSINYKQGSYLFLAKQENAHLLEHNIAVQKKAGVKVRRFLFFKVPLFFLILIKVQVDLDYFHTESITDSITV